MYYLKYMFTKKQIILFLYLATVFAMPSLFATVQKSEIVIVNKDTLYTSETPLEKLLDEASWAGTYMQNVQSEMGISSACWRGYVGLWEVIDKTLFLRALYDCRLENQIDLKKMFGNKCRNGSVKADWYSGSIYCLKYMLPPVSGPLRKIKEQEIFVTKGRVDSIANYDLSKIQYSNFIDEPDKLEEYVYKHLNWKKIPRNVLSDTTRAGFRISGNEEGRVDSVQVFASVNKEVDEQIISILKTLPTWSVDYQRNTFDRVYSSVIIFLDERKRMQYSK